jgi:hypothetical protein
MMQLSLTVQIDHVGAALELCQPQKGKTIYCIRADKLIRRRGGGGAPTPLNRWLTRARASVQPMSPRFRTMRAVATER